MRQRIRTVLLLVGVIASATAGVRWNNARLAPPPVPRGSRVVFPHRLLWVDSGRTVTGLAYVPVGADRRPTLLFSPGFGVRADAYSTFLTDIASHGFIVISVPHPPLIDSANAQLMDVQPLAARALRVAMDYIARRTDDSVVQRVDTARVGALGHSIGGAAAALACDGRRIKAAVNIDGSMYGLLVHEGVACPFLLVQRALRVTDTLETPVFHEERSQGRLHEDSVRAHTRQMEWVTIDGLDHMSFTDAGLAFATRHWVTEAIGVRLNATRAQRQTADLAMGFLAKHLGPTRRPE